MGVKHPATFEAPTKEELDTIKVGSTVKVCTGNERFWTIITEIKGQKITATVDNNLVNEENEDIPYVTEIHFQKKHIYDVYPEPAKK
jgi:hypothetical protein